MGDEQSGVTVTGVGSVRVPTTEATVRLRVSSRQPQPGAALRDAGSIVAKALDVLRATGVPDSDIRTETVSVSPNTVWRDDTEQIDGYDATQSLRVRVERLSALDRMLGMLVDECGSALQVEDVSLTAEPADDALSAAREHAVRDARTKAADYARLTGRTLGRAESVVEQEGPSRRLPPRGRMALTQQAAMPVTAGVDTSSVTVQIRWSFE